jgi:multiple sugar transport system permease protein
VVITKRFFDSLPREVLDAAWIDGAGPYRLFWSVAARLPSIAPATDLSVPLAAMAISAALPILFFLVFQRLFLRSDGLEGAVKG